MGWKDIVHGALDLAGLVPGVGEIADGINAVIYLAEGDYKNAAISAAAMVPVAGTAATVVKIAKTADKVASTVKATNRATDAKKTYQTYTKTNPETGEVYSGRTSGTGTPEQNVAKRDANHQKNTEGYGPAVLDKSSDNADAIRGREQQNIENNGGAQSQNGTSGNSINGVSDKNQKKQQYSDAANKEFGTN